MDDTTFKWIIILAVILIMAVALYALYLVMFVPCECTQVTTMQYIGLNHSVVPGVVTVGT